MCVDKTTVGCRIGYFQPQSQSISNCQKCLDGNADYAFAQSLLAATWGVSPAEVTPKVLSDKNIDISGFAGGCDSCSQTNICNLCSSAFFPVNSNINSTILACRCSLGRYLHKGLCLDACPSGFYTANTTDIRACVPCPMGCAICDPSNKCSACLAPDFNFDSLNKTCICKNNKLYY